MSRKGLTSDQRRLFVQWMVTHDFWLTELKITDRETIIGAIILNEYDAHTKWKLGIIREKWIIYLIKIKNKLNYEG